MRFDSFYQYYFEDVVLYLYKSLHLQTPVFKMAKET